MAGLLLLRASSYVLATLRAPLLGMEFASAASKVCASCLLRVLTCNVRHLEGRNKGGMESACVSQSAPRTPEPAVHAWPALPISLSEGVNLYSRPSHRRGCQWWWTWSAAAAASRAGGAGDLPVASRGQVFAACAQTAAAMGVGAWLLRARAADVGASALHNDPEVVARLLAGAPLLVGRARGPTASSSQPHSRLYRMNV